MLDESNASNYGTALPCPRCGTAPTVSRSYAFYCACECYDGPEDGMIGASPDSPEKAVLDWNDSVEFYLDNLRST